MRVHGARAAGGPVAEPADLPPWNDLANTAYCQEGKLYVQCATVDGVQLPTYVGGFSDGLAGALPPSLGDLGPSLMSLGLANNAITSLPAELAALTGLETLSLANTLPNGNQLTGVPTDFRTWGPSSYCYLFDNPGFSCANVGAGTKCCSGDGPEGNGCGEGLPGGPCYTG